MIDLIVKEQRTIEDIKELAASSNLFNASSASRAKEIRQAVLRRINAVDSGFLSRVYPGALERELWRCAGQVFPPWQELKSAGYDCGSQDGGWLYQAPVSGRQFREGRHRGVSEDGAGDAPSCEGATEKTGRHGVLRRQLQLYRPGDL